MPLIPSTFLLLQKYNTNNSKNLEFLCKNQYFEKIGYHFIIILNRPTVNKTSFLILEIRILTKITKIETICKSFCR